MKKHTSLIIRAHIIRGAFYLLLLLAVCVIPFALAQRQDGGAPLPEQKRPDPVCVHGWSPGPDLPSTAVRSVGIYFQTGNFYVMGGRSSDSPGSDFTHPFEYSLATNSWTTKSATYPDNQVNNMACGILVDAGTSCIYCVGGSAAGQTTATNRMFRYNPVTDTITTIPAPWPGDNDGITLPGGFAASP